MSEHDPMRRFGAVLAAMQDQAKVEGRARARAGFLMAASLRSRRRQPWQGWRRWTAAGLCACAALVFALYLAAPPPPLTFVVGGDRRVGDEQSWIVAPQSEPLAVSFSDGSTIDLRPRARARVVDSDARAPRVVLESGSAVIDVREADRTWTFEAGPCRIVLEDAAVELAWNDEPGRCEIVVSRGSVRAELPDDASAAVLRAGDRRQWQIADAARASQLANAAPARPRVAAPRDAVIPAPAAPSSRRTERVGRSSATPGVSAPDWRALAAGGDYRAAVAAARASGFSRLCATLAAEDLLELADASRYARENKLALTALQAVRRRFAGSDAAAVAALDIGRLHAGDCSRAAPWFRAYIDERPGGALIEVARKRLRECDDGQGRSAG